MWNSHGKAIVVASSRMDGSQDGNNFRTQQKDRLRCAIILINDLRFRWLFQSKSLNKCRRVKPPESKVPNALSLSVSPVAGC